MFSWLRLLLIGLSCSLILNSLFAQAEEAPQDYPSPDFHEGRRAALRELMPPNSAAIVFANPVRNRANDVDYVYHQNPDFYYLTGLREPHAVLIIFKEPQAWKEGEPTDEIIFVQHRNAYQEMWTGRRLGVEGVREQLQVALVKSNQEFLHWNWQAAKLDRIFLFPFREDIHPGSNGQLFSLVESTKEKLAYTGEIPPDRYRLYELIRTTEEENSANVAQVINRYLAKNPSFPGDPLVSYRDAETPFEREVIAERLPTSNLDFAGLEIMMNRLREIKQPEELQLLRKAVDISAQGQIEVMKAMTPEMSERQIQGIHEMVYKMYDAEYEGYPSIVGAGENGCILHYIDNQRPGLKDDLVLMDLGAEYRGYTADVTRTIPADGTFSDEQRAIYDLVLKAQNAAIATCKPGASFGAPHAAARAVIQKGLEELGIIQQGDFHGYFPHGTSHYLGLDVHDRGSYGPLEVNMVITVEPGIYIPPGSDCEEKWWGIAVRIEDDILITPSGSENLSKRAPRSAEEVEAMMRQPSILNDWNLPNLD